MLRLSLLVTLVFAVIPARADLVVYSASDQGAGWGDPRPNSEAIAAQFDSAAAALGGSSSATFEPSPLGSFSTLTAALGVTVRGASNFFPTSIEATNTPALTTILGYNTTHAGSHYLYFAGGSVTFHFASGVEAWGAYISGIQYSDETITFNDGQDRSVQIPGLSFDQGGIAFVGFTDAGKSIRSVTINAVHDIEYLGIDDARFTPQSVPEPSSVWLAVIGGVAIGAAILRAGGRMGRTRER